MFSEKDAKEIMKPYMENEFWREEYETAPSENCKKYIELRYMAGSYASAEEYKADRAKMEKSLSHNDWAHLYKYSGHNPRRTYFKKKMEE